MQTEKTEPGPDGGTGLGRVSLLPFRESEAHPPLSIISSAVRLPDERPGRLLEDRRVPFNRVQEGRHAGGGPWGLVAFVKCQNRASPRRSNQRGGGVRGRKARVGRRPAPPGPVCGERTGVYAERDLYP